MVRSCGDSVRVSTRPVAVNNHVVMNRPLRPPHRSTSFWGLASCLSARTIVIGARSVTPPRRYAAPFLLIAYGCLPFTKTVQFKLIGRELCKLNTLSTSNCTNGQTSLLSWYRERKCCVVNLAIVHSGQGSRGKSNICARACAAKIER